MGEVPEPVLFNTWKHHAGTLRRHVHESAADGEPGLTRLAGHVAVLGNDLMDLYLGPLSPAEIAAEMLFYLEAENLLRLEAFRAWLERSGGYAKITVARDHSQWVLRMGAEESRYVHVHPARWAPATRRVRANVLKTAVLVSAYVTAFGGEPFDVKLVNQIRGQYLNLSPMQKVDANQGLRPVIEVLLGKAQVDQD